MIPRSPFFRKEGWSLSFISQWCIDYIFNFALSKKNVIKFPCLPQFRMYFILACFFSAVNYSENRFIPHEVSDFNVELVIDNFFSWVVFNFKRVSKFSFHFWSFYSWLVALSFDLEMLLFPQTLSTVYYANWNCSSTEFLILIIWLWMYWICFLNETVSDSKRTPRLTFGLVGMHPVQLRFLGGW